MSLGKTDDGIEITCETLQGVRGRRYKYFIDGDTIIREDINLTKDIEDFLQYYVDNNYGVMFVENNDLPA